MFEVNSFIAILIAVLVHELSHVVAIYAVGKKITGFSLELSGLKIEYSGLGCCKADLIAAISGPVGGLVYAYFAIKLCEVLALSAKFSMIYSCFNLLPVYPLDGGRAMLFLLGEMSGEYAALAICEKTSKVIVAIIVIAGMILWAFGEGGALFAAGIWLLLMQNGN